MSESIPLAKEFYTPKLVRQAVREFSDYLTATFRLTEADVFIQVQVRQAHRSQEKTFIRELLNYALDLSVKERFARG